MLSLLATCNLFVRPQGYTQRDHTQQQGRGSHEMRSKHSPAPELAVHVTRDALAHDVSEPGPTGCWKDAVYFPRGLEAAGNTTGPALSLVPKDCFRRKSLWGKQRGKEERTTKEGQGSLSCCTWYPKSPSTSHGGGGRGDLHIAHGVRKH